MPSVYLGVHLPFKPYHKLKVENVDLGGRTETLRSEAAKLIKDDVAADDFELVYCGSLLKTDDILQNKGISDGSMIHVIQKRREQDVPPSEQKPQEDREITEAEVQAVLSIWRTVDSSNFQKVRQPEFMKNVLDAYPAIRRNLFVLTLLKDPILLSSMQQPETIRRVAPKHPVLLEASRTIVQLLNSKMISKVANCHLSAPLDSALDDPLSDSSSSDDNTVSPTTSAAPPNTIRRITADNLASALAFAGSRGSYNSLSNISQRDADSRANQQDLAADGSTVAGTDTNLPSTSSATSSQPTSSNNAATGRITSSMLLDAISLMFEQQRGEQAAGSGSAGGNAVATNQQGTTLTGSAPTVEPMDTSPATASTVRAPEPMGNDLGAQTLSQHSTLAASIGQYRRELDTMREMGLTDTETNLQALIVCNGNVESAINLVFGGMSN
ncbi:ubiquitin-like protein 7 [Anopheles marshallii]|uniref:ubiquitin-like protein 7 n=1 Tax=Anopheles marshallii TaxID=1521116 RepID=UPI00237AFEEE|nr:ubiquitin-like protein 7 [Anopheles marshallii]